MSIEWASGPNAVAVESGASASSADLIIHGGGRIGYVIIGCSIIGVGLVIDTWLAFRKSKLIPPDATAVIEERIARRDLAGAREAASQTTGILGPMVAAGLERLPGGLSAAEDAASAVADESAIRLQGKVGWISLLATTCPLLGLYGTVWGMMEAFATIERLAAPRPSELAEGIKIALVTTFQGLSVAIPMSAAAYWLRARLTNALLDASAKAATILGRAGAGS